MKKVRIIQFLWKTTSIFVLKNFEIYFYDAVDKNFPKFWCCSNNINIKYPSEKRILFKNINISQTLFLSLSLSRCVVYTERWFRIRRKRGGEFSKRADDCVGTEERTRQKNAKPAEFKFSTRFQYQNYIFFQNFATVTFLNSA